MRRELLSEGRLWPGSVVAMHAGCTAHALATAAALSGGVERVDLPTPAVVTGAMLAAGGAVVCASQAGSLMTARVHRVSRDPQHLGYPLTVVGLGLARRCSGALALATAATGLWR